MQVDPCRCCCHSALIVSAPEPIAVSASPMPEISLAVYHGSCSLVSVVDHVLMVETAPYAVRVSLRQEMIWQCAKGGVFGLKQAKEGCD